MKWTICFFVRDLATRRVVHHEIEEVDAADLTASDRVKRDRQRVSELMQQYNPDTHEVFLQGFDCPGALYSAWPELAPKD